MEHSSKANNRNNRNEEEKFEQLFKTYYPQLCRYAYIIIRDADQAEEIVQEFFFRYWINRKKLAIRLSLKSYMYRSVRNASIRYLQHRQTVAKHMQEVSANSNIAYPTDGIESNELRNIIEQTLGSLPERSRKAFTLSRIHGLKYKEIASLLTVSIKTVEADITKALAAFRENLTSHGYPGK